jgi:phosphoenolpyruvate carboxylase
MSNSQTKSFIDIIHPRPKHFSEIQELCRRVYPFTKPWSIEQLESHFSYFPDGQLIAIDQKSKNIVGLAFSLIIPWVDYSPQDSWSDFTSNGFFHNHSPKKGTTLYGAEVMVDPQMRGRGIGKLLYKKRENIVYKYGLKRIRAGARLRGYSKFHTTLTPQAYVIKVIERKIYDPTLSFQLNQGFQVIDVAKNYLFDDPESLGHAAVIEWLNPKLCSPKDLKRQQSRCESFLIIKKLEHDTLPRELRRLVRKSILTLGNVIRESEGIEFYNKVEAYRSTLKSMRELTGPKPLKALMKDIEKESPSNQLKLAHAFSLHLEIVNSCEAAYRTWRQRLRPISQGLKTKTRLKFVLTAHPTEARSPIVVKRFENISEILIEGINNNFLYKDQELLSHMRFLWHIPLSKPKTPQVIDEADFIFSLVFSDHNFDFIVSPKPNYDLKLGTWVGGDKDGHPDVTAKIMVRCLTKSRVRILDIIRNKLEFVLQDLKELNNTVHPNQFKSRKLILRINELDTLKELSDGDGHRVKKWVMKFNRLLTESPPLITNHYQINLIKNIIDVFPALVLPIDLRENAQEIKKALTYSKAAINQMLLALKNISGALNLTHYVSGFIISHCESIHDLENTIHLVRSSAKTNILPIIPLFESKQALLNAPHILRSWLKNKSHLEQVKRHWLGYFEIMMGYSDSAKEIGVLPSRLLIQNAMLACETVLKSIGIKPIFFHGSGGSIARGGGSLKEQISWWPNTAIENPKVTIQGEMIQRMFATKEILNSQCSHLSNETKRRKIRKVRFTSSPELRTFSKLIESEYNAFVTNQENLNTFLNASPYRYLDLLKIGSRPSNRPMKSPSLSSLRAIPWVLCWTQTRSLLSTWWGVGTAWNKLSKKEREKLKKEYVKNPLFSSFVKSMGFTLAKVEMSVWKLYFDKLSEKDLFAKMDSEYESAKDFVFSMSGSRKLVWYRPWLEESIRLRSPQIHILNVLQVIAMKRKDEPLLKETLVGIASGMLTTG